MRTSSLIVPLICCLGACSPRMGSVQTIIIRPPPLEERCGSDESLGEPPSANDDGRERLESRITRIERTMVALAATCIPCTAEDDTVAVFFDEGFSDLPRQGGYEMGPDVEPDFDTQFP